MKKFIILLFVSLTAFCASAQRSPVYHALEGTYITLQLTDVYTTQKGISMGAYETNPAMRYMIDRKLLLPAKLLGTSAFLYSCRRIHKQDPRLATWYLAAGSIIMGAVVFNNYRVTIKMKI